VVLLGEGTDREQARELITRYRAANLDQAEVTRQRDEILGVVQITTPDHSMDILVNRRLLYQTLSCRVWGRAAFYQTSGAYGFRDQLQDVMALTVAKTRCRSCASIACCLTPIHRGRRPALVAPAVGTRRPDAHFG
jgi:cyclic beta-1,2-glucan synthetase